MTVWLTAGLTAAVGLSASAQPPAAPTAQEAAVPSWKAAYAGARSQRGERYYGRMFGVDQLEVRSTASGSSLEFRYRVLDPGKAAVLQDQRQRPLMIDRATGVRLTVPTVEKIGELRQAVKPEAGREYWMIFANPGKLVKPGSRVDIVVGPLRVSGLYVE